MKRLFITLTAVALLLGLAWLVPHSLFSVTVATPTPPLPTVDAVNTPALATLPVQPATSTDGASISAAGVSFTIPLGLASGAQAEVVAASLPTEPMQAWPQHLKFVLQGYNLPNTLYQPQILVFPAAEYEQMSNNPIASQYDAKTMVTNLQAILTTQQIPAWKSIIPIDGMNQPERNYLPFLPDQHAAQVFHAQENILAFQNGSGLRYVTAFSQAHYPAIGPELLYTFQGLTSDGKYYVSVILPLNQPNLPGMPTTAENDANYPAYLAATVAILNQPEGAGVNPLAPSLATLDALAQSITVLEPATPPQVSDNPTNLWKTYTSQLDGFAFEYPAVYDEPPYTEACGLKEGADGIQIGHQIALSYLDADGLSLAEFGDNFVKNKNWRVETQQNEPINGLEATTIEYRFGGANRFGTITFIRHAGQTLAINFSAGSFCAVPENQVSEPNAYAHIIATLRFDQAEAACPTPGADTQLLTDRARGYCLLYPAGYSTAMANHIVINPVSAPGGDMPGDAWLAITMESAAGRTAAQVAEAQIAAVGQGFNITTMPLMIDNEPAVMIDGLPGQDSTRRVLIVRADRLYTLTFTRGIRAPLVRRNLPRWKTCIRWLRRLSASCHDTPASALKERFPTTDRN